VLSIIVTAQLADRIEKTAEAEDRSVSSVGRTAL
jgi:hypothetical protein